jgi:hypothetical protein
MKLWRVQVSVITRNSETEEVDYTESFDRYFSDFEKARRFALDAGRDLGMWQDALCERFIEYEISEGRELKRVTREREETVTVTRKEVTWE